MITTAITYSDPTRESDPYALPDVEIFYISALDSQELHANPITREDSGPIPSGHYYWFCFPGCLPDSDRFGPFDSTKEAENDAISTF